MGNRRRTTTTKRDADLAINLQAKPSVRLPRTLAALVKRHKRGESYVTYCIARIPGGQAVVYEVLKLFPDEPIAEVVVEAWNQKGNPQSHQRVPLEEILEAAEVEAEDFMALVTRLLVRIGLPAGHMIAAAAYPDMMEASVRRALDVDKGGSEREMHFKHSGYVPVSKGIQIGIKNQNGPVIPDEPAGPGEADAFDRTARSVVRELPE